MEEKKIKEVVKRRYAQIAKQDQQNCCPSRACGANLLPQAQAVGYLREDLEQIPEEAVIGLGCGNPTAIEGLKADRKGFFYQPQLQYADGAGEGASG